MCEHPARLFLGVASQRDFNDYVVRRYVIDASPLEQFEAEASARMRIPPGEIGRPTSGNIFSGRIYNKRPERNCWRAIQLDSLTFN
ncbi:hypothetical protein OKW49_001232 [Paraburkholderia youngii]|uniref:hypothetical protein n=1 Tax=Paraburkholderia youngii TaxID=2782701 RepID=UPI003D1D021E